MLEAKLRILREISDNHNTHGYAIAHSLGLDTSTVYGHLKELEENGYLVSRRLGKRQVYDLTQKGGELLKLLQS